MSTAIDQPPPPRVKRWTKDEYYDLVERGVFRHQRVYLFRGDIIEMSPQYHPHAYAVTELTAALHEVFGIRAGFRIRIQLPFEVPGDSVPEPDGLVCTDAQSQRHPHPNEAVLVIEVADSSLAEDREKAIEYASAKVPEYWIIDVNNRRVEVYRDPIPDDTARLGFRYASIEHLNVAQEIEPLSKSGVKVPVWQFFH
jgi:Uma2 family endonuclease